MITSVTWRSTIPSTSAKNGLLLEWKTSRQSQACLGHPLVILIPFLVKDISFERIKLITFRSYSTCGRFSDNGKLVLDLNFHYLQSFRRV